MFLYLLNLIFNIVIDIHGRASCGNFSKFILQYLVCEKSKIVLTEQYEYKSVSKTTLRLEHGCSCHHGQILSIF